MPDILAILGVIPKFRENAGKREKGAYVWIDTEGERLLLRFLRGKRKTDY